MKDQIKQGTEELTFLMRKVEELAVEYLPKLALAIVFLIVGLWIIKHLTKLLKQGMEKGNVDPTLIPFVSRLVSTLLKIVLIISVAQRIGIPVTSFVALLGATSLAIGLALQGSLSNFAGGVLLLILKPYQVGDLVNIDGFEGLVEEIGIFNTTFLTLDTKTIIMPNGKISNDTIVNLSAKGYRRVDLQIGIGYKEDLLKAQQVIKETVENNPLVLSDPSPDIEVLELADSAVVFAVRPYANYKDYWSVYFGCMKEIKLALDANNISIPFPQRDVHIIKENRV